MKCPYPDCTGEITADEQFCGECGRSLAPTAVAAAKAGMAFTGIPTQPLSPPIRPPGPPPLQAAPPAAVPPTPTYTPPLVVVAPPAVAPARASARLPWLLGGAVGAVLLSIACCLGSLAFIAENVPLTPTAGAPATQTFHFALTDLTQANHYKVVQDVRAADGSKLGVISLNANYTYEQLGSAELIGTVELRINDSVVLELAASNQPVYATSNPAFEVAQAGHTYTATSAEGWAVRATVSTLAIEEQPKLGQGGVGAQPVFATLALDVEVDPTPPS